MNDMMKNTQFEIGSDLMHDSANIFKNIVKKIS